MDKILIVDDDSAIRRSLKRHLIKAGYQVVEAGDGQEGLQVVSEERPDLILLDVMMPEMDGFELCTKLRQDSRYKQTYIIFLSAKAKLEDRVNGLEQGADDYVVKPFEPAELIARIKTGMRTLKDKRAAIFDELTGLYNRHHFNDLLVQESSRSLRYQTPLSLVMLDLDHFKKVNDTYGHLVGDEVLKTVAKLMMQLCRKIDLAARWGGEEMVLLLPETELAGAMTLAERLRKLIENHPFAHGGQVTASLGVAQRTEEGGMMLGQADQALYQAKQTGRNKVCAAPLEKPEEAACTKS